MHPGSTPGETRFPVNVELPLFGHFLVDTAIDTVVPIMYFGEPTIFAASNQTSDLNNGRCMSYSVEHGR